MRVPCPHTPERLLVILHGSPNHSHKKQQAALGTWVTNNKVTNTPRATGFVLLLFSTTWMEPEVTVLSEISQALGGKHRVISHSFGS